MIQSIKVERYRGIERLELKGLRRVNLITGKNDCGKTALIEAIGVGLNGTLGYVQVKRDLGIAPTEFDQYWRPAFYRGDAERGLQIELQTDDRLMRFEVQKPSKEVKRSRKVGDDPHAAHRTWTLLEKYEIGGQKEEGQIYLSSLGDVESSERTLCYSTEWYWIHAKPDLTESDLSLFSDLKQAGKEGFVVELLRRINDQIQSIDLLSPSGKEAKLFVRIGDVIPMLPFHMLGQGTRRCFEFALIMATDKTQVACIDEIENGLHHSTTEIVWRFLATASKSRDVQIFATTHSEECIQTAARIFTELDDDGLCVIRLDRHEHETTAALYDKNLVEATERMGVEIRG